MDNIQTRCTNASCHFHNYTMPWPEGLPLTACPICGSAMEPATGMTGIGENTMDEPGHWLAQIAGDTECWLPDAEKTYPSVIAHEYRCLREYCRKEEPYAVLLSLKDNFEALLKLEVLLAYAWAARNTNEAFEAQTVSLLTTPNLSFGAWMELASVLGKGLKKVGVGLPDAIPLEKLRKRYLKAEVVNWRNSKLGHGAMGMSEDEEFRHDIREKILLLKDLLLSVDSFLRNQELYLPGEGEESGEISLTGADRARGLERSGPVYFRTRDGETGFCTDPFIVIRRHEKKGNGTYFFDNQRTSSLTNFLAYAEGSRANESVGYFEALRRKLELSGVKEEARADDPYLTVEEIRELDLLQMSHSFVKPAHLADWLKGCLEEHDRGIFLLQMNRGTGKSVFTEKVSSLGGKPLKLTEDTDVRTYHIGRSQAAGTGDIRSGIEWQWSSDYTGKTWARAPRISDYEREGKDPGEALCAYLEEVLRYGRRNRGSEKVLMVLDGLDEIADGELWKFIPGEEMLGEGVYFLLTSRDPETEALPEDTAARLEELTVTEKYCPERTGAGNTSFLREYIKGTGLKGLDEEDKKRLLDLCDHRVLELGLLCRLMEGGMGIEELPDSSRVVSVYLEELEKRYGEKEAVHIRELLAVLCTLGTYEGLTLGTLGVLTGENGVTLRLIGIVRDLAPMLKTERSEEGNLYMIANPGLAEELEKQIPETEDTVRWIVKLTMSVLRDGGLEKESELEVAAAHVVELAVDKLPEGLEVLGDDVKKVLLNAINEAAKQMVFYHERERVIDYRKQLLFYCRAKYGENNQNTLGPQFSLALSLKECGHYKEAVSVMKDLYERRLRLLGCADPIILYLQTELKHIIEEYGTSEELLEIKQSLIPAEPKAKAEDEEPIGIDNITEEQELIDVQRKSKEQYKEELFQKKALFEKNKKEFGDFHRDTLEAQKGIVHIMNMLDYHEEALEIKGDLLDKFRVMYGDDHIKTLDMTESIVHSLKAIRNYKKALHVCRELYERCLHNFGEDALYSIYVQDDLAHIYGNVGQYEKEIRLCREVCKKSTQRFGEFNPRTIIYQLHLADALCRDGHSEEAFQIVERIYQYSRDTFGNRHANTIKYQYELILILGEMDDCKEKLGIEQELYNYCKTELGEEHSNTLIIQDNLTKTLRMLGCHEEALRLYIQMLYTRRKVLNEDSPFLITYEIYIGYRQSLGENNLETLNAQAKYALAIGDIGFHKAAIKLELDVYEKRRKLLGEDNKETITALNNLAWSFDKAGDYINAIISQKKLINMCIEKYGRYDLNVIKSIIRLAEFFEHAGNYKEMEREAKRAEELYNRSEYKDSYTKSKIMILRHSSSMLSELLDGFKS